MTLTDARRLHRNALNSERVAETYERMSAMIENLLTEGDAYDHETIRRAMGKFELDAQEFYADADDLRSQIAPELIDQL